MKLDVYKTEQLILKEVEKPITSCAFTGHRILDNDFSILKLKKEIKNLIERGVVVFYCGMAPGFDLLAGEIVVKYKMKYKDIKLYACIPCVNQEKYYCAEDKKRYAQLYKKADETTILFEQYTKGCMLARDRFMADKADVLLAYCKKDTGGTAYTVKYFSTKYPLKEKIFL
ncbi:MAG: DUF1273 domain-containing protein [Clostridiales bacterium]|nr:DUF1273 domain-containing protein [Clostridiales bacterium]